MDRDLIFENKMENLLGRLDELEVGKPSPEDSVEGYYNQDQGGQEGDQKAKSGGVGLGKGEQGGRPTEPYPGDKKFSYLPTPTLYSTYYGPDADKWPQSNKEMYMPLKDGRVGRHLVKYIEKNSQGDKRTKIEHIGEKIAISKASDYQFRIRVPVRIKFETRIRVDVGDDEASIKLESISLPTPFNLHKGGEFTRKDDWLKNLKPIELQNVDTDRMSQWEKEVTDEEADEARKYVRNVYKDVSEGEITGASGSDKEKIRKRARKIVQTIINGLKQDSVPQSLGNIHKAGNFTGDTVIEAASKSLKKKVPSEKLGEWIADNSHDIFGIDLSITTDLPKVMHMGAAPGAEETEGESEREGEEERGEGEGESEEDVTERPAYNIAKAWAKESDPEYSGLSRKEAPRFAKWAAENHPDEFSEEDADLDIDEIMKKYTSTMIELAKEYNKKQEGYTINLSDYLKNLLTEKKSGKGKKKSKRTEDPTGQAIEQELGGEIIGELNKKLFKRWFGVPRGIAATDNDLRFEGKLYEFFEADSARFFPQERKNIPESETQEFKFSFYLDGYIRSTGYIWIDARIGENGGIDKWTFRVHDNPNKPFFTTKFGGVKGTGLAKVRGTKSAGAPKDTDQYAREVDRPDKGNPADTGQGGQQSGQGG